MAALEFIQSVMLDAVCVQNGYNKPMDKLAAMQAFSKVVALGSFAAAGRQLGLTRSAVSKGVLELEQGLGARLLDRTTRKVSPTEAGLAYYERCVEILGQIAETELHVSRLHDEPKGVLKLNAPMSFGATYLGPAIADFMSAYPELKIELVLNDRFVDPIEEGFDVTVRIAELEDFEPDRTQARTGTPCRGRIFEVPRRARNPENAIRPRRSSLSQLRTHNDVAALAPQRQRRKNLGPDQFGDVFQQWRCALCCGTCGPWFSAAADVHRRTRDQGETPEASLKQFSTARTRDLCAVRTQPLSRGQDPRSHRFPCRPLRTPTRLG